jgi:hypothetical protein
MPGGSWHDDSDSPQSEFSCQQHALASLRCRDYRLGTLCRATHQWSRPAEAWLSARFGHCANTRAIRRALPAQGVAFWAVAHSFRSRARRSCAEGMLRARKALEGADWLFMREIFKLSQPPDTMRDIVSMARETPGRRHREGAPKNRESQRPMAAPVPETTGFAVLRTL